MTVPHEIEVDPSSSPTNALVGGSTEARLTVEYLVEAGASSPEVRVTATSNGASTEWSDTGIAVGFHTQSDVLTAQPGTRVSIEVTDAMARLRWCETICC